MKIIKYMLNLLIKKPSKQKNTIEIDDELEREILTLKELINTIEKNTELTYKKIDELKNIRDELKRQYDANYKYPIFLKNREIDLPEIDLFERPTALNIDSVGGGLPHNNMQPYVVLRYLIKY